MNKHTCKRIKIRFGGGEVMKGYIVLETGDIFKGDIIGEVDGDIHAEIVFFTGMTGYQEVLSDPSFKGQVLSSLS